MGSFRKFRYEMSEGDVIFAKSGTELVGKGRVMGPYEYKRGVLRKRGYGCWAHFRRVKWEQDFHTILKDEAQKAFEAQQHTVLLLDGGRLEELLAAEEKLRRASKRDETLRPTSREPKQRMVEGLTVVEGKRAKREIDFQVRNRAVIAKKKRQSDGKCEVCGFATSDGYSGLARDILVGHHLVPLGRWVGTRETPIEDIAIVCPSCHQAMHTEDPPLTIAQLVEKLNVPF